MSADDIRIAWNPVTGRLCAVHADDGTYAPVEVHFPPVLDLPSELERMTRAPGGVRLIIGPTLAEVRDAFERALERG